MAYDDRLDQVDLDLGTDQLNEMVGILNNATSIADEAEKRRHREKIQNLREEQEFEIKITNEISRLGLQTDKDQHAKKMKNLAEERAKKKANITDPKALQAIDREYDRKEKREQRLAQKRQKWADQYKTQQEREKTVKKHHAAGQELLKDLTSDSSSQRLAAIRGLYRDFKGENGLAGREEALNKSFALIADLAKKLEGQVDKIANKKSGIDTRLQGSKNKKMFGVSYWDQISFDMMGIAGVSPLIKQENIVNKVEEFVGKGISYNVEQRAFLATISEKIATTFNATDGTLLRLVRIQQQDSTAGRLGMESMINAFLNNMYETTEYLEGIADSVRSSLDEVESLMGAADAVALEYQVQKWMGSLYSVGMSRNSVEGIASAFGKLAAGDISGIQGGGMGNLMIMAANQAGLSIADILARGLDDSETNKLMAAMVEYLQQIAGDSSDSRVVQQQLAKVYGLTASDLRAATNMAPSMGATFNSTLNYAGAMKRLNSMANSMYARTSMGEMMSNVWENFQYTMAAGMASNPVTYLLYKTASLLDSVAGGIALPDIKVMGSGVNLQTTVADLMRVASMSGGVLAGLGSMISNLSAGGGFAPAGMLKALGISSNLTTVARGGKGVNYTPVSGSGTSESGSLVGAGGDNIKEKTLADAADDQNSKMENAKEDENNDLMNKDLNVSIIKIYDLLERMVNGTAPITTRTNEGLVGGFY